MFGIWGILEGKWHMVSSWPNIVGEKELGMPRQKDKRLLMGTFGVDVVEFMKAGRWLERRGIVLEGRNSVIRALVSMASDLEEQERGKELLGIDREAIEEIVWKENDIDAAFRWVDEKFPVKNYTRGTRRKKIEGGLENARVKSFGSEEDRRIAMRARSRDWRSEENIPRELIDEVGGEGEVDKIWGSYSEVREHLAKFNVNIGSFIDALRVAVENKKVGIDIEAAGREETKKIAPQVVVANTEGLAVGVVEDEKEDLVKRRLADPLAGLKMLEDIEKEGGENGSE